MRIGRRLLVLACVASAAHGVAAERCQRLFALRRSTDRNEVVYEACFEGSAPAAERPVRAHWEMRETDGHHEELTAFESRFAFGVSLRRTSAGAVVFALRAAPEREMIVQGTGESTCAVLPIGGEPSLLLDVFVAVERPALIPAVRYVELGGVSLADGRLVSERIEP